MRYLAIDFGTKKHGLAVCDPGEFLVSPLRTLVRSRSRDHDLAELARIVLAEQVDALVLGLPLNADGSRGPSAERVERFAEAVGQVIALPLYFQDEFQSSELAEAELIAQDVSREKRRAVIDQMAAVEILERFLKAKEAR